MKKGKMKKGIRQKLIIGLIPISIVTLLLINIVLSFILNYSNNLQINSKILNEGQSITVNLNNWLESNKLIVNSFESAFVAGQKTGLSANEYEDFLNTLVKPFPEFLELYFWDINNKELYCASGYKPESGWDASTRPWYTNCINIDTIAFCDPYIDKNTGNPCVTASIRIKNSEGEVIGVMGGDMLISSLQEKLENIKLTNSSYGLLINPNDGLIIANSNRNKLDTDLNINEITRYKKILSKLNEEENTIVKFMENGTKMIASLSIMPSSGWRFAILSSESDMKKFIDNNLYIYIYSSIIILVFTVAAYIAWFIRKNIEKPLSNIQKNISTNFSNIKGLSSELSDSSIKLSTNTKEQRSAIEFTELNMNETTNTIEQNTQSTLDATNASNAATNSALLGSEKLKNMQSTVEKLKESSTEIKSIIKVIDDIAFQTNILALNASVEAARAGEAGKGFEVVAEEVRNLASKTTIAAKNINEIILMNIQYSDECSKITDEAFSSLTEIVQNSETLNQIISNINTASIEQSKVIEQVNTSIMNLGKLATFNEENVVSQNSIIATSIQDELTDLNNSIALLNKLING